MQIIKTRSPEIYMTLFWKSSFFLVLFFPFLHNMYRFLPHSQVIRDTSRISTLLACPGVRLSGKCHCCDNQREEGGRKNLNLQQIYRNLVLETTLNNSGLIQRFKSYVQWCRWVWLVDRRAVERSQACREGYGRSMDSFPLVLGGTSSNSPLL